MCFRKVFRDKLTRVESPNGTGTAVACQLCICCIPKGHKTTPAHALRHLSYSALGVL